jgi:DNA repair protein RadD
MKLRPIQQHVIDSSMASFKSGSTYHLLQAPVGFGKTIVAGFLMKEALESYGARSLFLCHLTELVVQTVEKFNKIAPDLSCGVLCGSLDEREVQQITVGTRQTVAQNLDTLGKINLIIIDEVHLFSAQYQKIVDYFLALNPRLKVVGVTGTPYTIKQGWIYGDGKMWPEPFHATTMDEMIELGYLSPYRYKMAQNLEEELAGVKKTAGEYHESDLGEMMQEERHMGSVKHAIETYAKGRKSILVFAVTIEHAEALASFLGCHCVHSQLKRDLWRERVDRFKGGQDRILVNVTQLSIGFDAPAVDCLVVARPTMSPALHVQIAGRSLRICEGKKDALILDLVGNYLRHGLPSNPKIRSPKEKQKDNEKKEKEANVCEVCFFVVDDGSLVCPECGAEMVKKKNIIEKNEKIKMIEVERSRHKIIKAWEKEDYVTKKGNIGSLFCLKVTNREKPLFRFCGSGSARMIKERKRIKKLRSGDVVQIANTAYGDWIE